MTTASWSTSRPGLVAAVQVHAEFDIDPGESPGAELLAVVWRSASRGSDSGDDRNWCRDRGRGRLRISAARRGVGS
jgi:hypothetical protein